MVLALETEIALVVYPVVVDFYLHSVEILIVVIKEFRKYFSVQSAALNSESSHCCDLSAELSVLRIKITRNLVCTA